MHDKLKHLEIIARLAYEYRDAEQSFEIFQTQTFHDKQEIAKTKLDTALALHMADYTPAKFRNMDEMD